MRAGPGAFDLKGMTTLLGQFPQFREWLGGDRMVKSLQAHSVAITNRKFESTFNANRDDV
jgi:phage major head subunit gpT-like protein